MMPYSGINIQGNIISPEILERIRNENLPYQQPADFGLERNVPMREEIGYAWQAARLHWQAFQLKRERLGAGESGASETRFSWIIPLLKELGYDVEKSTADVIDGKSYAISHRASNWNGFPVHIMGIHDQLDKRREKSGPRLSPHALVQEYLNNTEHLYALVTNGRFLRLLRDATRLTRLSFLEFDLERIMEEELYPDFAMLYRLLHATRMPESPEEGEKAVIEEYHQLSLETGARIRDELRNAVEKAMKLLANGWLAHPDNHAFAEAVRNGNIAPELFYQGLLRVIYRLLFIIVIEERNLVFPDVEEEAEKDAINRFRNIYQQYYSLARLQKLAMKKHLANGRKTDLWQSVRATFSLFDSSGRGRPLHVLPLGGELFDVNGLEVSGFNLAGLSLENKAVLDVIGYLTLFEDEQRQLVRVNYSALDVEELGSVYEALLDLAPNFSKGQEQVQFGFRTGTERKTTGSYYTRSDLVLELIKSALEPVMEERLSGAATPKEKEEALLSIKICDAAAGSGHFLLAAARRVATELARVRSGEDNPGEAWYRPAIREVIQRCIYGVDRNPPAAELCRFSLWLEGHHPGKPLSFLDHKIRVGDSLIGIDRLERLKDGIPDNAFKPASGDDRKLASYYKKLNRDFLKKKQLGLFAQAEKLSKDLKEMASEYESVARIREETLDEQRQKREQYEKLRQRGNWMTDWTACNLFTYSFYQPFSEGIPEYLVVTSELLSRHLNNPGATHSQLAAKANAMALELCFFHWPLEFPEVFEQGGFDVMLGNPPWERIKLQEQEFFATQDEAIATAPNKAARGKLIKKLPESNPALYQAYLDALHESEAASKFIRESERYPLTGRGDVNTYSIFSELFKKNTIHEGRAGFIVPTGIATDDTNKYYFASLVEDNRLISLFDFENRKKIFPSVDSRFKFSLITLSGSNLPIGEKARFGFFLHDVLGLDNKLRVFGLTKEDFININPNTKTCPIFRTSVDAELTAKIYSRVPVLIKEETGQNPWGLSFLRMFDMANDSHLFRARTELEGEGFRLGGNRFVKGDEVWLPLYEAKMIWHYNHRLNSYQDAIKRSDGTISFDNLKMSDAVPIPWYWIKESTVKKQVPENWNQNFFLGLRDVTNVTNERTSIFCIIPKSGVGHTMPLVFSGIGNEITLLIINSATLCLDYLARQKLGGTHLSYNYLNQFPYLIANHYHKESKHFLFPRFFELTYTSWDIKAFADDLWREADAALRQALQQQWEDNQAETGGHEWELPEWKGAYPEIAWERAAACPLPPFKWDAGRRARLQAELDAYYAKLYGLSRDELRYILDPQEVYGEDFPGETFRVLKEKDIKKYGEYRTRRLVLEAYDALSWFDEKAQVEKLERLMEEYRREGEEAKMVKYVQPAELKRAAEPEEGYGDGGQGRLF